MADAPVHLVLHDVNGWYGESHVLHGVDLSVPKGGSVMLVGRNGAGKTTTLRAIMGLIGRRSGRIEVHGQDVTRLKPHRIAAAGLAYVPEERGIYASLTVEENLALPPVIRPGGMSLQEIHALFPNLLERRRSPGTKLSGGEQQMLAIARVLRTGADLLLLDEPTEGLAPVIVERIAGVLNVLKERGMTILLVEQNLAFARDIVDRIHVMEHGRIVDSLGREEIRRGMQRLEKHLSV